MSTATTKSLSDASYNILGFKYQELVALLKCLNCIESNVTIFLECAAGDVSTSTESIEVKHSIDPSKVLNNTHKDFWNTLNNIIKEYDKFKLFGKFILHTTAQIKEGSIFDGWDELSDKQKRDGLLNILPNKGIQKYFNRIKNAPAKELKDVLRKFEIHANQKTAKEFYRQELLEHVAIVRILSEEHRAPFIYQLLGYISMQLIDCNGSSWEINIDIFNENFRSYHNLYRIKDLKFPSIKEKEIKEEVNLLDNKYRFIEQIKLINCHPHLNKAVKDYFRARYSQIRMIESRASLSNELDDYDEEIKEEIELLRMIHITSLKKETEMEDASKDFFHASINKVVSMRDIHGVVGVKSYYPLGRMHYMVEDTDTFTWKLKTDDNS